MKRVLPILSLILVIILGTTPLGIAEALPTPGPQQLPVTDKEITITWYIEFANTQANNQGEVEGYAELAKRAGVNIEWIHPSPGSGDAEFNLMMASGDYPDVITLNWRNAKGGPNKYLEDGVIFDVSELAEKYVPNYMAGIERSKQMYLDNGATYGFFIPISDPIMAAWKGFIIRKEWLEKLDLDEPQTISDWYEVLKAFRDGDPNGNGEADEIPLVTPREKNFASFVPAWGITNTYFFDNAKQGVAFGPIEDGYKSFLTEMAKWYAEGLIDPEYVAIDGQTAQAKLMQDKAGAALDFTSGINNYPVGLSSIGIEGTFVGVLPPALTPDGKHYTENAGFMNEVGGSVTAITTACEHPEVVAKLLNYMYSEEGRNLINWGIEGLTYEVIDGKKVFTDFIMKDPTISPYEKITKYAYPNWTYNVPTDVEAYVQTEYVIPAQKEASMLWATADRSLLIPPLTFTEDESTRLGNINTDVNTYVSEMTSKFIMGLEPLENFDAYVNTIKSMGIEDAIQVYQDALDRYNAR